MKSYTPFQYMLIDLANHFGLDKVTFEERIQWATDNIKNLEALSAQAETVPLYKKAVLAIRQVQSGKPTGHLVGLDSVCSGIQIMSAITGCIAGATATGLVDPDVRADAYSSLTQAMNNILIQQGLSVDISRDNAKRAMMTSFYGSNLVPKEVFGEDTPELNAFYQAANIVAPGAWELLQELLSSWQANAKVHAWTLPDGFYARVKVMQKKEARIEVDELDHATFTYYYYENEGTKSGLSNAANVIHSIDAYILRSMHRRCNYKPNELINALSILNAEINYRNTYATSYHGRTPSPKLAYYLEQYERSKMTDITMIPYLTYEDAKAIPTSLLIKLREICMSMNEHAPFEIITIHDEYKCSPKYMEQLRKHYIEIFAELADSEILSDILSQIHGVKGTYTKKSNNLSSLILKSNYALT